MSKSRERPERYQQHSFDLEGHVRPPRRIVTPEDIVRLHEALEPFIDLPDLRRCVAEGQNVYHALRVDTPPKALRAMMDTLAAVLHPGKREQIRSPADVAGLMMLEMGSLMQEELRTVLLDTKNRVQTIQTVYKGSLNTSLIRVGEIFREAIRYNSAAVIVAHNHPSSDPTPSPDDVLVTREIVAAGRLLDIDVLDHIVVGQDKFVSMKERRLGF